MYQQPNNRLKKQTCIVTGANSGIGRAVAVAMARDGANVVVNYVFGDESAQQVVDEIKQAGGTAIAVKADVSKEDQVIAMFQETVSTFGTVDILVNNAGLQRDSAFHNMPLKD